MPTDLRERVARAAYNHGAHKTDPPWERLSTSTKKDWLGYAKAVLLELKNELRLTQSSEAAVAEPVACPHLTPMGECIKARQAAIAGVQAGIDLMRGNFEVVATLGDAAPQPQASAEDVRAVAACMRSRNAEWVTQYRAWMRIEADYERMGVGRE